MALLVSGGWLYVTIKEMKNSLRRELSLVISAEATREVLSPTGPSNPDEYTRQINKGRALARSAFMLSQAGSEFVHDKPHNALTDSL